MAFCRAQLLGLGCLAGLSSGGCFARSDLQRHAAGGFVVASVCLVWSGGSREGALLGAGLGSAIGLAKEGLDAAGFGTPDLADAAATIVGALVPFLFLFLTDVIDVDVDTTD